MALKGDDDIFSNIDENPSELTKKDENINDLIKYLLHSTNLEKIETMLEKAFTLNEYKTYSSDIKDFCASCLKDIYEMIEKFHKENSIEDDLVYLDDESNKKFFENNLNKIFKNLSEKYIKLLK